jgi:hypothetical protein
MEFLKKIKKKMLRHPWLYSARYMLISKNNPTVYSDDLARFDQFNDLSVIPELFFKINPQINLQPQADELEKAKQIGQFLRSNAKPGPAIGLSPETTLKKMLDGQGGVCSDFSEMLNLFCLMHNIPVKEWGCVDQLYQTQFGHSFNEIYSNALKKWVAIDIHKGILFKDAVGNYLSTIELFRSLRAGSDLNLEHYSDYRSPKTERLPFVYAAYTIPFLVDNRNFKFISNCFRKNEKKYPKLLIDSWIILNRKNQKFIFILDNYKKLLFKKSSATHSGNKKQNFTTNKPN